MYNRLINVFVDFFMIDSDEFTEHTILLQEQFLEEDSMDDLLQAINDEFDIVLDREFFDECETIREMVEYIENIV